MPLIAHLPRTELGRLTRARRGGHARSGGPRAGEASRARQGGAPQDRALYTCGCGCAFTAAVTTTVGCPHCGTAQAW